MSNVPPIDEGDTTPMLPVADTEPPPPIIRAGEAQRALTQAFRDLSRAQATVEALAIACARALDGSGTGAL